MLELRIDGETIQVVDGATVAVALMQRRAEASPVCGMGTCFACSVQIDGVPHRRACLVRARAGMEVKTRG